MLILISMFQKNNFEKVLSRAKIKKNPASSLKPVTAIFLSAIKKSRMSEYVFIVRRLSTNVIIIIRKKER